MQKNCLTGPMNTGGALMNENLQLMTIYVF